MSEAYLKDVEFTEEERRFIHLMALQPFSYTGWNRVWLVASFYMPSVLLGLYGIYDASLKIVSIAFLTIVSGLAWGLANEFQQSRQTALCFSIFKKMHTAAVISGKQ